MPRIESKDMNYSYLEPEPALGVSPEFKKQVKKNKELSEIATESSTMPTLSESKSNIKEGFKSTGELSKKATDDFEKLMQLIRENQDKNKFTPTSIE